MNLKFFLFLLNRYLFSSWMYKQKLKQGFAPGTVIPVCGVTVGVFAFVVVLSVMGGFVSNIKSEIIKLNPHIQIVSKIHGQDIPKNENLIDRIKEIDPSQILFISAFQSGDSIIQSENQATLVTLEGIDPINSPNVLDISQFLVAGAGFSDLEKNISVRSDASNPTKKSEEEFLPLPPAIIGRDLALQLNLNIDDVTTLVSILFDEGFAPLQMPVVISGIYDTGRAYLDSKVIYISLENANRFFLSPKMWKGLQIKLKDPFHPNPVVEKLNNFFLKENLSLVAQPWTVKNSALLKALFLEHVGMIVVMSMIILVGCFSITISLLLSLHRKTRELAILRGLGLTQKDLSKIYLGQGFLIGLTGVALGLLLGLVTLYVLHNYSIPFLANSYFNATLPMLINPTDIVFVSLGSILLATLAAFWPAYEVRRLNVIDVLAIRQ